jgi:hypothetical protein
MEDKAEMRQMSVAAVVLVAIQAPAAMVAHLTVTLAVLALVVQVQVAALVTVVVIKTAAQVAVLAY